MLERVSSAASQSAIGLAGLALAILSSSCSQSPEDAKRDAAVQRMMNRPKPGYVRLLNLTSKSADLFDDNRLLNPTIPPGEASRLSPIKAGDVEVIVKFTDKSVKVKVGIQSGIGTTIVMFPDERTEIIGDEPIKPVGDSNIHVAFVGGGSAKATSGGKSVDLSSGKSEYTFTLGEWTVGGPGLSGTARQNVEDKLAYSILIVRGRPFFLLNTNNDQPIAGGVS